MTTFLILCILVIAIALWISHRQQLQDENRLQDTINRANVNFDNLEDWLKRHNRKLKALRLHLKLPQGYENAEVTDGKKKGMKYIDGPNGWCSINPQVTDTYDAKQLAKDLGLQESKPKKKGKK